MSQNLASVHFTDEQWAPVDGAINALAEAIRAMLVPLGATARKRVVKMGDGSEAFCRKAADVAADNLGVMPRNFDLEEFRRDLASHDALNARIVRLRQLLEQMRNTEMALGSDAMVAALEAYSFLKNSEGEGAEELRRMLGERFVGNGRRKADPAPVPVPVPPVASVPRTASVPPTN
jgi:hypothetical protein